MFSLLYFVYLVRSRRHFHLLFLLLMHISFLFVVYIVTIYVCFPCLKIDDTISNLLAAAWRATLGNDTQISMKTLAGFVNLAFDSFILGRPSLAVLATVIFIYTIQLA